MTATSPYLQRPCRTLSEVQRQLRGRRIMLLSAQMEFEAAGNKPAAAHCLRQIADVEARLRGIEHAGDG